MSKLLPVGKVSKLFGLDGGVLVNLYDTLNGDINIGEPLFVMIDGLAVPFFTGYFERRGKSGSLMRFDDMDTPERAAELIGREIFVRQETEIGYREEEDDGLFADELAGYKAVVTEQGGRTLEGSVTAFVDDEFNPLWQLEIAGIEVFIPAADEFIAAIDPVGRVVSFTVPEGLLGLYL